MNFGFPGAGIHLFRDNAIPKNLRILVCSIPNLFIGESLSPGPGARLVLLELEELTTEYK